MNYFSEYHAKKIGCWIHVVDESCRHRPWHAKMVFEKKFHGRKNLFDQTILVQRQVHDHAVCNVVPFSEPGTIFKLF